MGEGGGGDSGPCGSAMPAPPGYDPSQVLFQDSFCGVTLDGNKWAGYVPGYNDHGLFNPPLSGPNSGGVYAEYWSPSQVTLNSGLRLTAVANSTEPGYEAKSGAITTLATIGFGGPTGRTYLQVRAKIPSANGMWPHVVLGPLPNSSASAIGFLSTGFRDIVEGTPLTNIESDVGGSTAYYDTRTDLSAAFTDYGVEIVWGQSVTWYWNTIGGQRQQARRAASGDAGVAIPTSAEGETLFIQLDVVNEQAASWHTVWNGSDSDTFSVSAIQVYAQ